MHFSDVLAADGLDDVSLVVRGMEAGAAASLGLTVQGSAACQRVLQTQSSDKCSGCARWNNSSLSPLIFDMLNCSFNSQNSSAPYKASFEYWNWNYISEVIHRYEWAQKYKIYILIVSPPPTLQSKHMRAWPLRLLPSQSYTQTQTAAVQTLELTSNVI